MVIRATDGVTPDDETITITITNTNPTVVDNDVSIAESVANSAAVATITTTGDTTNIAWSITAGNTDGDSDNNAPFAINSATGAITVNDADDINYESTTSYTLTVQASDQATGSPNTDTETITVTITDVDEFDVGAVSDSNNAANTVAELSLIHI